MKKFKKFFTIFLVVSCFAGIGFGNESVNSSIKSFNINGQTKTANVVTVDLNDQNLRFEVVKANDKITSSEPFKEMIARKNPIAAINANFFDAYKTLVPYGSIIRNGKIIYLEGKNASFSVLDNNAVHMDEYQIILKGYLDGNRQNYYDSKAKKMVFSLFNIWYVNNKPYDATGAYLYTPEYGESIELNGGYVVVVKNDKVVEIINNPIVTVIPKDGYLIYYGSNCVFESYVRDRFSKGRSVEIECEVVEDKESITKVSNYTNDKEEPKENDKKAIKESEKKESEIDKSVFYLKDAKQLISAGPLLIREGQNVVNITKEGFKEDKIKNNPAQRSAIGITRDKKIVFVTISRTTVNDLALIMQQLNCAYAMNLDGGASSALYANDKIITTPGRNLNTVLMVLKNESKAIEIN